MSYTNEEISHNLGSRKMYEINNVHWKHSFYNYLLYVGCLTSKSLTHRERQLYEDDEKKINTNSTQNQHYIFYSYL